MTPLALLPAWAYAGGLALCRCGAAVMLMPGLGEAEPPPMLRAGLALALTALILPSLTPLAAPGPFQAAGAVAAELLCGATLGWLARCAVLALPMAGQLASYWLGLTSVVVPDPALGQGGATMRLFALAVPVLVLGTGLWRLPVAALAGSYAIIPPGQLLPAADTARAALAAVSATFALALRLAAPLLLASVVWNVGLGLIARLVPGLQIYFAAVPGQLLGGLALLALLAAGLVDAFLNATADSFAALPGL